MPKITVGQENSGSIDLYYEDHGTGKPIVLIHGYPFSGRAWEKQLPALMEAGYRVITYDRRGFGQSSQPVTGYDYDTFAEDLHSLLSELDLHDVALVGHSMGGGELARYMGKYGTKEVSKAIFVSSITPCLRAAPDNPDGLPGSVFDGIKKAVVADRPAFIAKFCADFFNADVLLGKLVSDNAIEANWNIGVAASPKGTLDCVDTWGTDFRADLKRVDIPTLVIQGDADRIVPFPNSGKRMGEFLKNNKLVKIEGGPHAIPWTHADVVNREMLAFLGVAKSAAVR
jgi:pimeloyl-ACP methyl ester carboxylesterase